MRMKGAYSYFHHYVAMWHSVCLKHLLKHLYVTRYCATAHKVVCCQAEFFPLCIFRSFLDFIKIPVIPDLHYVRVNEDPVLHLCVSYPWKHLLQILDTLSIPLHGLHRIFHQFKHGVKGTVNLHVGHLQCNSASAEAAYCEAT